MDFNKKNNELAVTKTLLVNTLVAGTNKTYIIVKCPRHQGQTGDNLVCKRLECLT